jgi:hypothetical protein
MFNEEELKTVRSVIEQTWEQVSCDLPNGGYFRSDVIELTLDADRWEWSTKHSPEVKALMEGLLIISFH